MEACARHAAATLALSRFACSAAAAFLCALRAGLPPPLQATPPAAAAGAQAATDAGACAAAPAAPDAAAIAACCCGCMLGPLASPAKPCLPSHAVPRLTCPSLPASGPAGGQDALAAAAVAGFVAGLDTRRLQRCAEGAGLGAVDGRRGAMEPRVAAHLLPDVLSLLGMLGDTPLPELQVHCLRA